MEGGEKGYPIAQNTEKQRQHRPSIHFFDLLANDGGSSLRGSCFLVSSLLRDSSDFFGRLELHDGSAWCWFLTIARGASRDVCATPANDLRGALAVFNVDTVVEVAEQKGDVGAVRSGITRT